MDDLIEFVLVFPFYLQSSRGFFDLRGESVLVVRFEEGDVEGFVYGH